MGRHAKGLGLRGRVAAIRVTPVPRDARIGGAMAVGLLTVFCLLLLVTAAARRAEKRDLTVALDRGLLARGVVVRLPTRSSDCQPELPYRLKCSVQLEGGGVAEYDLSYVDSGGCWLAARSSGAHAGQSLPARLQGCM
jgi:hypothetical protein